MHSDNVVGQISLPHEYQPTKMSALLKDGPIAMNSVFSNRSHAGQALAPLLLGLKGDARLVARRVPRSRRNVGAELVLELTDEAALSALASELRKEPASAVSLEQDSDHGAA